MKYRIFTAILNQVEEMKHLVSQIPDLTNLTILNNYDNPQAEELCKNLEKQGVEVLRFPNNPGSAFVFNTAMVGPNHKWDSPMRDGLDFVLIVSPSCIFKNDITDFVKIVEEKESKHSNYFYWAPSQKYITDMQCQAIMKRCVDEIGLFDENFVPYSYEDMDYTRRIWLNGHKKNRIEMERDSFGLSLPLQKEQRLLQHYQLNAQHIYDYYVRKWGGEQGKEKYNHPFNDKNFDLKEWYPENDLIAKLPEK